MEYRNMWNAGFHPRSTTLTSDGNLPECSRVLPPNYDWKDLMLFPGYSPFYPADIALIGLLLRARFAFKCSTVPAVFAEPFFKLLTNALADDSVLLGLYFIYRIISYCIDDYQAYLDLGRGGTPSSIWGWWRIKRLSLCKIPSVLEPPHVPPMLNPYRGLLEYIPRRDGPRPKIGGIAPQRQINQKAPRSTFDKLEAYLKDYATKYPDQLNVETSFLEGHTIALKARPTELSNARETTPQFGYEICHPHGNDGSLHMIMHPEDVKTVIESGWGERHPLARDSWWWKLYYEEWIKGRRPPVPETLVFVYAPKNAEEIAVVKELVRAAAWWITGVELGERDLETKTRTEPEEVRKGRSYGSVV